MKRRAPTVAAIDAPQFGTPIAPRACAAGRLASLAAAIAGTAPPREEHQRCNGRLDAAPAFGDGDPRPDRDADPARPRVRR